MMGRRRGVGARAASNGVQMPTQTVLAISRQVEWARETTRLLLALRSGLRRAEPWAAVGAEGTLTVAGRPRCLVRLRLMRAAIRLALAGRWWVCRSGAVVKPWDAVLVNHGGAELVVRILAGDRCDIDCAVVVDSAVATRGTLLRVSADDLLARWREHR